MPITKYYIINLFDEITINYINLNKIKRIRFNHTLNKVEDWNDVLFDGPRTKYQGHRSMVLGNDANGPHIGRISNLGRQQTCMLRFYRKTEALGVIETSVPLPERDKFDLDSESKLIQDAELQTQQSTALFLNYGPKT